MSLYLNQSEYALHAGVSAMAVSKAVRSGKIPLTSDGRIDPKVADVAWRRRSTPQIGRGTIASLPSAPKDPEPFPAKPDGDDDYFVHRAAREKWNALQAELDYQRKAGELVPAKEVESEWVKAALVVKGAVQGLPTAIKQNIPHLNREEMALIERLCLECLEELACTASQP